MELEDIKRGLRAEIKKRENEQYDTFQCNVRQMCKDVLAKLEEQESVLAEKDKEIAELEERIADGDKDFEMVNNQNERLIKTVLHHKHKRCLAMANWCAAECVVNQNTYKKYFTHKSEFRIEHFRKWYFRLLELSEKFKEAK